MLPNPAEWTIVVLTSITILAVIMIGATTMLIIGYERFQNHSIVNRTNHVTLYENDTVVLGKVSDEDESIVIVHQCSGDSLNVDLYLAPNCELTQYVSTIHFEPQFIHSQKGTMVIPIPFAWKSVHIFLSLNSSLTFLVDLINSTHADPVVLVGFNNYTYYIEYLHNQSPNPPSDKAYIQHEFKESNNSSYTFTPKEENTYFFALGSNVGTNYSYGYNGTLYNYNYTDYEESQCKLPAKDCKHSQCSFNFTEKVCILGHIKYTTDTSQTFANIRTDTSQITHQSRRTGVIFITCGLIALFIATLVAALTLFTYCVCLIQQSSRTSESQPLLSNVN